RQETRNLERVEIADQTQTASPRVTVAISRDEVPPQLHLRLQRRPQRVEQVLASGNLGRVPDVSRVLVGVAIVAAGGQGVVREERPGGELHGGAIEEPVEQRTILEEAHLEAHRGNAR